MHDVKHAAALATIMYLALSFFALVSGVVVGFDAREKNYCHAPFSRLTTYVIPAWRLGCWLTGPEGETK